MSGIKDKISIGVDKATNAQSLVYLAMTAGMSFPQGIQQWYFPFCLLILAGLSYLTRESGGSVNHLDPIDQPLDKSRKALR